MTCYYIEFKSGERLIVSETKEQTLDESLIASKERWSRIDACKRTYPDVDVDLGEEG